MSDDFDTLLTALIECGFPPPMAAGIARRIMAQEDPERSEFQRLVRFYPDKIRELAKEACGHGEALFPARIVARKDDGTFDLEIDTTQEWSRLLRTNLEVLSEFIGLDYRHGTRFSSVPGVEGKPIHKSAVHAAIGFKDMDMGKPYAVPALKIIGGAIPREESTDAGDRGPPDVN